MRTALLALAGLALIAATVPTDTPPLDPAAAISLADSTPQAGAVGLFRMTVAAVGKSRKITFLNSNADYRSAGNVTFSLSEDAARHLTERLGGTEPAALVGRTIVVAGRIERRPVVNVNAAGKSLGFNRWSYNVRVSKPGQLVSITAG